MGRTKAHLKDGNIFFLYCASLPFSGKDSYLEQVLPARKLARGGASPGLGKMSTSARRTFVTC